MFLRNDKTSTAKRQGYKNVLVEDYDVVRDIHSTKNGKTFALTKSRFLIILIIISGAFIYAFVLEDETEFYNSTTPWHEGGAINESTINGLDKWWEKMFCTELNYFASFFKEKSKLMLKEFLVDIHPQKNEFGNIYMIENNCESSLSWRMRCSAESVARANVNATLFVITIANHLTDENKIMSRWLQKYPNIIPVKLNLNRLFYNSPLQRFSSRKAWTKVQSFIHAHVSDAMRLALVWTSGGTYYDSDIIVTRSLPEENNVFMLESYFRVVNAFIKARKHHPLLTQSMEYFNAHYKKRKWDSNGPELLSNMIQKYCGTKDILPGRCKDLNIVEPVVGIQPIHWKEIGELFTEIKKQSNINDFFFQTFLKNAHGVHFNNHLTSSQYIDFEKDTLFNRLVAEFCPFTYKEWKRESKDSSWILQ